MVNPVAVTPLLPASFLHRC